MAEEQVKELLQDPTISSQEKLWKEIKKRGIKITKKRATQLFKGTNEVVGKPTVVPKIPITCPWGTPGCLQIDLMDVSRYKNHNNGVTFLFHAIDIHTRYAWSYPIKKKEAQHVLPQLMKVIEQMKKEQPKSMIHVASDDGGEFKGVVKQYLKEQGVRTHHTTYKQNMAVVERFNRTMWTMIQRYVNVTKKANFVKLIPRMVERYNNSDHSALADGTPQDAWEHKTDPITFLKPEPFPPPKDNPNLGGYKVGDTVRIQLDIGKFAKRSVTNKFSDEIYQIIKIIGNRIRLKNVSSGHILQREYLARELMKTRQEAPKKKVEDLQGRISEKNRRARVQAREPVVPKRFQPQTRQRRPRNTRAPDRLIF